MAAKQQPGSKDYRTTAGASPRQVGKGGPGRTGQGKKKSRRVYNRGKHSDDETSETEGETETEEGTDSEEEQ